MQHARPDRPIDDAAAAEGAGGDWTDSERDLLARLWRTGRPLIEIAAALGRSPEAVRSRARRLKLAPRRRRLAGPGAARMRSCLCCATPFPSEGPHHRLCDECRQADGGDYRVVLL